MDNWEYRDGYVTLYRACNIVNDEDLLRTRLSEEEWTLLRAWLKRKGAKLGVIEAMISNDATRVVIIIECGESDDCWIVCGKVMKLASKGMWIGNRVVELVKEDILHRDRSRKKR